MLQSAPGPKSWPRCSGSGMPRRKEDREKREAHRTYNSKRPHMMAQCGRAAAQSVRREGCQHQQQRCFDGASDQQGERKFGCTWQVHDPLSFLLLAMRAESRSSSSEEILQPSPPSSAATAFSVDPSKKVSTTCRRAERRATSRGTQGM